MQGPGCNPSCQADALEPLLILKGKFLSGNWGSTDAPSHALLQHSRENGAAEGAGAEVEGGAVAGERAGPVPAPLPARQDPTRPSIAHRAPQRRQGSAAGIPQRLISSRKPARSGRQQTRPNAPIYTTTYL